jgi:N utilization substance protein B
MLNRRILRIKVMQALYAFFQGEEDSLAVAENQLFRSFDRLYDLYILQLILLTEIYHEAQRHIEESKNKFFPSDEDRLENNYFAANRVLQALTDSETLRAQANKRRLTWDNQGDMGLKLFRKIRNSQLYKSYIFATDNDYAKDRDFIVKAYEKIISDDDILAAYYESENIHWSDDFDLVNYAVIKTLKGWEEGTSLPLVSLYRDEEDDKEFVKTLFRKTIVNNDKYSVYVEQNAKNWESDRMALMDVLLMKMCVCELFEFSSIPVKVSMNEYIEISKSFSTPKSNAFINGILDKITEQLRKENKLQKSGRGLIEN